MSAGSGKTRSDTGTLGAPGSAPKMVTELPGPKAKAAIERDRQVTSPSYTRSVPLVADRAQGCVVEDVDGNRFLDFAAGIAVCATGHAHPAVVAAIQKQAARLIHICSSIFYYEPMVALSEKLAQITPGNQPKRVLLANSGTEAIEAAMKLVRRNTGRKWLIAFDGAFHGRTMGALSVTSSKVRQKEGFGPLIPMVAHAPYGDISGIENIFRREASPEEVAAIFVEPIQGEGGYVIPAPAFFKDLRALCDEHGILLVFDEIQTGMGRTGKMFACQHFGVVPDLICVAKGIASGMPLGAVVAPESVMDWPPGSHGSTLAGNPVCCAAALATIELIEDEYMANAEAMGQLLRRRLGQIGERRPAIQNVRGLGLITGVDVVAPGASSPSESRALRNAVVKEAFNRGLILMGCGEMTVRFIPPLCITQQELNTGLDVFEQAVEANTG